MSYAHGALARDAVRAAWTDDEARRGIEATRSSLDQSAAFAVSALGSPVAHLVIPRIGLDEIVVEGVGDRELNAGPGHLPGSALPGERGNAVISAHRDRHFSALDELAIGDTVVTEAGALRVTWVVTRRVVLSRFAPALHRSTGPVLTLTTCWPVRNLGPAPDRLLLTALPVDRTPRA